MTDEIDYEGIEPAEARALIDRKAAHQRASDVFQHVSVELLHEEGILQDPQLLSEVQKKFDVQARGTTTAHAWVKAVRAAVDQVKAEKDPQYLKMSDEEFLQKDAEKKAAKAAANRAAEADHRRSLREPQITAPKNHWPGEAPADAVRRMSPAEFKEYEREQDQARHKRRIQSGR